MVIRIRELRKKYGLKRSDLARALDMNQGTLANYENGARQAPYQMLIVIADFFGVTLDYLLCREAVTSTQAQKAPSLSRDEEQLLACYRASTEQNQKKLLAVSKILSED